jgi:hypothetical protein
MKIFKKLVIAFFILVIIYFSLYIYTTSQYSLVYITKSESDNSLLNDEKQVRIYDGLENPLLCFAVGGKWDKTCGAICSYICIK